MKQTSVWWETLAPEEGQLLRRSDELPATAEVAIVGAGMIGLMTAYYLSLAGVREIVVLDRVHALAEASGANAGGLWFGHEGPGLGAMAPLAHMSSRLYDALNALPGFDFGFRRCGVLELVFDEAQAEERVAAARRAGFEIERLDAERLQRLEPALKAGPAGALYSPGDGQLHPGKLGARLVAVLRNNGVRFCFGVEGAPLPLDAGTAVIAAGAWTPFVTAALGWAPPLRPMRGQLLATAPLPPLLRHTIIGRRFYYWQLGEGHVAGGGTVEDAGFARGVNRDDLRAIRIEMRTLFPALAGRPTALAWCGFRPYSDDGLPVIGRVPGRERVWVAAGHFRKGILLAPATGKALADLITTGATEVDMSPFDPGRFA